MNLESNQAFIKNNVKNKSDILYQGFYTTTIILYATKEEINKYSEIKETRLISPCNNLVAAPATNPIHEQIGTDYQNGTKSSYYNRGVGYKGDGVKIGVIEAANEICKTNAAQLAPIINEKLFIVDNIRADNTIVPAVEGNHATIVTSLIVGQAVEVDGEVYEGVVPNATVYQMPSHDLVDFLGGMNQLIDEYGVSIINYSGGFVSGTVSDLGYRNGIDREVDNILESSQITFVCAAGNKTSQIPEAIHSPGKAYNAVTVGNARTKTNASSVASYPYAIATSSSFAENSYLTNKPDIVAPGSDISYVIGDEVEHNGGTSLAAPIVAGIVAQLHQAHSILKNNNTLTKAILLAGADFDAISEVNDNPMLPYASLHREKSGAGLVNAKNSTNITTNYNFDFFFLDLSSNDADNLYDVYVDLQAGDTIRIAVANNKPENIPLTSFYENDVTVFFCDENYEILSMVYSDNNIQMFEYTVSESGSYLITLTMNDYIPASTDTWFEIAVAWMITPNES